MTDVNILFNCQPSEFRIHLHEFSFSTECVSTAVTVDTLCVDDFLLVHETMGLGEGFINGKRYCSAVMVCRLPSQCSD